MDIIHACAPAADSGDDADDDAEKEEQKEEQDARAGASVRHDRDHEHDKSMEDEPFLARVRLCIGTRSRETCSTHNTMTSTGVSTSIGTTHDTVGPFPQRTGDDDDDVLMTMMTN